MQAKRHALPTAGFSLAAKYSCPAWWEEASLCKLQPIIISSYCCKHTALCGLQGKVTVRQLDLADLQSIKQFAEGVNAELPQLDVLVLNAGVMALPSRQETKDGFELQIGTNHIGHQYLTQLLLPKLSQVCRARGEWMRDWVEVQMLVRGQLVICCEAALPWLLCKAGTDRLSLLSCFELSHSLPHAVIATATHAQLLPLPYTSASAEPSCEGCRPFLGWPPLSWVGRRGLELGEALLRALEGIWRQQAGKCFVCQGASTKVRLDQRGLLQQAAGGAAWCRWLLMVQHG